MRPLKIAIVGAGVMGANHARVVGSHAATTLVAVVDPDMERADGIARPLGAAAIATVDSLPDCDAVIVAAPTEAHAALAESLLDRRVPLLVEKPLSAIVEDVESMIATARLGGVPLMCGFVERFNPAVRTAMGLIDEPPIHIVAMRHSPPTPRIRTSVVHDLLIHDIDLALRFNADVDVESTSASTWTAPTGVVDLADCTIGFEGGRVATLSSSRASQRKLRSLSVTTSTSLIEIDLLRHDVTVYRHRFHEQVDQGGPGYRAETVIDIPFVRHGGEPLSLQLDRFVDLVRGDADPADELSTLLAPHLVAARVEAVDLSERQLVR